MKNIYSVITLCGTHCGISLNRPSREPEVSFFPDALLSEATLSPGNCQPVTHTVEALALGNFYLCGSPLMSNLCWDGQGNLFLCNPSPFTFPSTGFRSGLPTKAINPALSPLDFLQGITSNKSLVFLTSSWHLLPKGTELTHKLASFY